MTRLPDEVDLHVGKRMRRRRRLLGLTQQKLASRVGTRFQQIQKYECGANRVTASKLHKIAVALNVPASYFFDGLEGAILPANPQAHADPDNIAHRAETRALVDAYSRLSERQRKALLDFAKASANATAEALLPSGPAHAA